ncbi:MAG: HEAT repeat domain-containing protein [Chloroflexi bacterium]|nr:HEAT repeat domain-containing protein [Chloroflexota bacterium]
MERKSIILVLLSIMGVLLSTCTVANLPAKDPATPSGVKFPEVTATTMATPAQQQTLSPTPTVTEEPLVLPSKEELDVRFEDEILPLVNQLILAAYDETLTLGENYQVAYIPKTSRLFYVQSVLGIDGSKIFATDDTVYILYEIERGESLTYSSVRQSSSAFTQEIIVNLQLVVRNNEKFFVIESQKVTGGSGSTTLTNLVDNSVPSLQKLAGNAADIENDLEEIIGYACGIDMSYSIDHQLEAALFTYALDSDNWADRYQAANALGKLDPLPLKSASELISLMGDSNEKVRTGAANTLNKMAQAETVFNLLLQAVDNPNDDIRYHAANILRDVYPDSDLLTETFLMLLHDADTMVRQEATIWLTDYRNPATIPSVIEALQDTNPDVRESAAQVLGEFGPDAVSAVPKLTQLLQDTDEDVRRAAAYALKNTGDPDGTALTELKKIAKNETDDMAFRAEISAITAFSDKETVVIILNEAFSDQNEDIREEICSILEDFQGVDGVTDLLLLALNDENEYIRRNAATSLANMTDDAAQIVPELKKVIVNEQISDAYGEEISALVALSGIDQVLPFLQEELERPEVKIRIAICKILGKYKNSPGVAGVLLIALSDQNENVRKVASEGLQGIDNSSTSHLAELYEAARRETDPDLFIDMVKKIAKSSSKADTIPLLSQALESDLIEFRVQACEALADYTGVKGAVSLLASSLDDQEASVRQAAAESLVDLGNEAATTLPDLLRVAQIENDRDAHYAEIKAIASLSDKESTLPILETGLQSTNVEIRRSVCRELRGYAGVPGAVDLLILAMDDEEYWVRYDAVDSLYWYGEEALPALPKLLITMKESKANMRVISAAAIGAIGPEASAAIPVLIAMVQNQQDYEKSFAVKALGKIGPLARQAVPILINLLDPDTIVNDYDLRPNCIEALESITLQNYGSDVQKWQEWWQKSQ